MASVGTFIINDLLPLRRRTVWQGLQNIAWAGGLGLGGVFGGLVNDTVGWRWIFFIMIPCTVAVATGAFFFLPRGLPRFRNEPDSETASPRFDVYGSVLLTSAVVCVVLGFNLQEGDDSQLLSLVLMTAAVVLFPGFLIADIWLVADPVIPLYLLKERSVLGVCVGGFSIAVSMHTPTFYVPLLTQVRGFSSSQTGLQVLGTAVGTVIGPPLIAVAMKQVGDYKVTKPISYVQYLIAALGFYFSRIETPVWMNMALLAIQGSGYGCILIVNMTALLANIDDRLQASGTSMQYAFRQTGASAGLGFAGIIFRAKFANEVSKMTAESPGVSTMLAASQDISILRRRQNYVASQPPAVCRAYLNALHHVFLFTFATAAVGFVFGMLIRNVSSDRPSMKQDEE